MIGTQSGYLIFGTQSDYLKWDAIEKTLLKMIVFCLPMICIQFNTIDCFFQRVSRKLYLFYEDKLEFIYLVNTVRRRSTQQWYIVKLARDQSKKMYYLGKHMNPWTKKKNHSVNTLLLFGKESINFRLLHRRRGSLSLIHISEPTRPY